MGANATTSSQHAAAMDRIYRRQRYIYDVTRRYYLLGRNEMLASLAPPDGGSILEIGCGTARNLIQAAALYPRTTLYGFDISSEMLATAKTSIAASQNAARIHVALGDAVTADLNALFGQSSFDRIFISYSLSMIPAWEDIIDRAAGQLTSGSSLHLVDFGRMDRMPAFARRALLGWLHKFSVTPRRELEATVRAIAKRHDLFIEFRDGPLGYWSSAILKRQ